MDKKICIIYTGGTIGMVPTENGYAPRKDYFRDILISSLNEEDDSLPDWDIIEFDPLLDSSNIDVTHWTKIGRAMTDLLFFMVQIPWRIQLQHFHSHLKISVNP